MKTIKIMSDGNQAKVGMICAYVENERPLRIEIGIITHIKDGTQQTPYDIGIWETDVYFKPIKPTWDWPRPIHYAELDKLSKATPEQKKLYWLELEKQTIQFRPEFETKLKELGIRDQFINNLFDPKCQTVSFNRQRGLLAETWEQLTLTSFDWYLSQEGEEFWERIYMK